jgi:Na+/H+ antiporter NhaA
MSERIGMFIGSVACILAVASAHLSFAPFTPAIVSVFATVPLGIFAFLLGAKHTGILALYWSAATIVAFPNVVPADWSGILYLVYFFGIGLGISLYIHYRGERVRGDCQQ